MGFISSVNAARKRSGREVSTSSNTAAAGFSRDATQVCRMVNAACPCVIVTYPGLTDTRSARSASGTGSSDPSK